MFNDPKRVAYNIDDRCIASFINESYRANQRDIRLVELFIHIYV